MNFLKNDLGNCTKGQIVEVRLTAAANVRLMDSYNFSAYRSGKKHKYYGGLVKQSPFHIQIPSSGHWYLTVDMQGLRGSTKAGVRILPSHLPEVRNVPLNSIPSLIQRNVPPNTEDNKDIYDVFISHASEDKDDIVRSLANALKGEGLKVWYDDFTLRIGDSLRQKIDNGLRNSRVGLVILSPAFIRKGWTNYELDGIITRSVSGEQTLLPIWHNLTKQDVINFSPSIADKVARSTATSTVEEIASEIADLLHNF
nr:DUF1883 domain-containing protein [uncultured Dethiosulfovibrio sp.]